MVSVAKHGMCDSYHDDLVNGNLMWYAAMSVGIGGVMNELQS